MFKNRRAPLALLVAVLWLGAVVMPNTFSSFSGSANRATTGAAKSAFQCEAYYDVVSRTPGITNYWRLGETGGATVANDSATGPAAQVRNLSIRNNPAKGISRTSTEANGSMSFTGQNTQYLDSNTSQFSFTGTTTWSVEVWLYIAANPKNNNERAFSNEDLTGSSGGRQGWNITYQKASDSILYERWNNGVSQNVRATVNGSDEWHHVVGTFDGTTSSLYIDGVLRDSNSNTVPLPAQTAWAMRVGATGEQKTVYSAGNSNQWWTGGIDDITLYNRAITPTEIHEHANTSCTYKNVVHRDKDAKNVWYLDEARGAANAADSQQNATCSVAGPVNFGDTAGLASGDGTSATFTGGRLTCPTATIFNGNAPFSVEVWVNMAQLPTNKAYIVGNKVPTGDGWSIYANPDGRVVFDRAVNGVATSITSSNALPSGWHMLTATFNGSGGSFYIDNTITGGATMNTSINSSAALVIGAATNAVSPWIGGIDNVSLYSRALSASDISNHWAAR